MTKEIGLKLNQTDLDWNVGKMLSSKTMTILGTGCLGKWQSRHPGGLEKVRIFRDLADYCSWQC